MNLYKIALSLLVTAAPAAARLSSDEKDSSAMMRELMAKVDAIQADNEALKNEVASLKKNRGLMADLDLEGMDLSDIEGIELPKELTDILPDLDVDPSSGGGPLTGILTEILLQLYGLKRCVGFDIDGPGRRLSGERRLPGYGDPTCFFGGPNVDVFIGGDFIDIDALWEIDLDAFAIGDFSIFRQTVAEDLLVDIENHSPLASATNTTEARKEKKAEFQAKVASMKETSP